MLATTDIFLFEEFRLDRQGEGLSRRDESGVYIPISIGSRALDVLGVLVGRPGALVSKEEIMRAVWGRTVVESANLTVQISALRRVLDEGRTEGSCIQTVAARGYRLVVPVTRVERANRVAEATFAASHDTGAACWPVATVNDDEAPSSEAVTDLPPAGTSAATARLPHLGRTPMLAIIAAAVVAAFVTWWVWSAPRLPTASAPAAVSAPKPIPPRLSIVVLPFANLSGDPDQQYLADGITEDLTTDLSRFPNTLVIARNTAFTYKSKPADATQIGRELGVRYLIEGSVRRSADQVQVNVQLIDAESGVHLWADRFETDRRNLAKAQDAITGRLAKTLSVELLGSASRRIEQERRADPDARDLAMRAAARALRGPGSPAVYQEVRRLFEQALEKDPDFVDAKVGIAMTLVSGVAGGWSTSVKEDEAQAEPILVAAIEQDPNNQTAHQVLGILRRVQYRLGEAKIELEIAISLDPNSTFANRHLGMTLMQMGQPAEGIPYIEKSIRLSPHDPYVFVPYQWLGQCHLLLEHVDQAIDSFRKAYAANPRNALTNLWLAAALGFSGDVEDARANLSEWLKSKPNLDSLARLRASLPANAKPQYLALREKTFEAGLRKAGMPEE